MPTGRRGRRQTPRENWQPLDRQRLAAMPHAVRRNEVDYIVSYVSRSAKTYTCPGCNHPIAPQVPHVVVWVSDAGYAPFGIDSGVGARRHWHTSCWGR